MQLINELGLQLGDAKVTRKYEINAEYKYTNGNVYKDESSFSKSYKDDSHRAIFDQFYFKIGILF